MPRDGNGVYSEPPGTTATPNTTILSAAYNALVADLVADLNAARPVSAGGTGGTSVITGWDGLAKKGTDIATASSINLTTATGPSLTLTGTTTVTAVTLAEGSIRIVRAAGAFQITSSASLLCNGSAVTNLTVAAEDLLVFRGGAASVVSVARIGSASVAAATTSAAGIVELATLAETLAYTDDERAVTPSTLPLPTGYLYGLTLANGTDATNDINIAAGSARDASDSYNFLLGSTYVKQIDAAWALGSAAGGLDTGSVGNSRYAIWGIGRSDTRVCDVLFSTSFSSPTMPANYDFKVLIGEFTRTGGTNGTPIWYGPRRAATGYAGITLGQSVASTSGTTIDFTGIPAWAKRVTIMLSGVSLSGTSTIIARLGTSGGFVTTGYIGSMVYLANTSSVVGSTLTNGMGIGLYNNAAGFASGALTICSAGGSSWVAQGGIGYSPQDITGMSGSSITLASALTQVRIMSGNGTDTFDAGSINISYE
jgi:hypothetical protein